MKINEMNRSRGEVARQALKENYRIDMRFDRLRLAETKSMLGRVRSLISEARTGASAHKRHSNPSYMKLVMMEQALAAHYGDLRTQHRIMLENEEVQKSQVILAAQDMIDSVQKMVEQISKMKVEELPAVVTGVNNEIGTSEGGQFETTATDALMKLEQALATAKSELNGALGVVTGDSGGMAPQGDDAFGGDEGEPEADFGDDTEMDLPELPDIGGDDEVEDDEEEDFGGAGRERR